MNQSQYERTSGVKVPHLGFPVEVLTSSRSRKCRAASFSSRRFAALSSASSFTSRSYYAHRVTVSTDSRRQSRSTRSGHCSRYKPQQVTGSLPFIAIVYCGKRDMRYSVRKWPIRTRVLNRNCTLTRCNVSHPEPLHE